MAFFKDGQLIGVAGLEAAEALTEGSVLFADGDGKAAQDNANFFWDDTGNQLRFGDDVQVAFGASQDAVVLYSTAQTPDSFVLGVSADSNALVVCEKADVSTDFANPLQTDPTWILQSADATKVYEATYHTWNSIKGKAIGAVAAAGSDYTIEAQSGGTSGDQDGGRVILLGGAKGNAGNDGYVSVGTGTPASSQIDRDSFYVTGKSEFADATYFMGGGINCYTDVRLRDDIYIFLGNGSDVAIGYNTNYQTPDALVVSVGADSNGLIICQKADITFDFSHALETNPTVFVHSANQSTTEWTSVAYGEIATGAGDLFLNPTGDVKFGTHAAITTETLSGYITIKDAAGNPRKLGVVS